MSVSGVQSCNFSGIFISTWSQTAGLKHFSLIRKVSLIKCHAYRWSRGEAGTAEGVGGGRRGGIWKPTEFVISRVMQDVWQLVRILTVLSVAWLPSWQVVIWALEGFHWLPLASLMRLWSFISGPQQWGTPKLLVLIAQRIPRLTRACGPHWGINKHARRWKPASLSRSECALRTPTPPMSVRFCSAPDHTRTHEHKHCKPHMRPSTLPNTHRHTLLAAVAHTPSPQCPNVQWKLFETPKALRQKRWKASGISEELYHTALLTALVATSNFTLGRLLKHVSLSSILLHLV